MFEPVEKTLYKSQDQFGALSVVETNMVRSLYFGNDKKQSSLFVPDPSVLVLPYAQAMMTSLIFSKKPEKILLVGLGGGSLIHFLLRAFPDVKIDVVEIRESVIELAYQFFFLNEFSDNVNIICADAEEYVSANSDIRNNYDLILVDAFDCNGPADINAKENFLQECRYMLNTTGVICFNLWNRITDSYSSSFQRLQKVFTGNILELRLGRQNSNVVVFGFKSDWYMDDEVQNQQYAIELNEKYGIDFPRYLNVIQSQNFSIIEKIKKKVFNSF